MNVVRACGWSVIWMLALLVPRNGYAHFAMVLPDPPLLTSNRQPCILTLGFGHPFTGIGLDMERPASVYVVYGGTRSDLTSRIAPITFMEHRGWQARYQCPRPGVYTFVMEPKPYWEAAENLYILQYTKTIIAAYGGDGGWDQPVGLPLEIVPLTRPYGNYASGVFVGQVLREGRPAAHLPVEIELYNREHWGAPSPWHETQVVMTDAQGRFVASCPVPGWWGFAALGKGRRQVPGPDGTLRDVEIGGLLWCHFDPLPGAGGEKHPEGGR